MQKYPCLTLNKQSLAHNAREVISRCEEHGVSVCGIIKGCNGASEVAAEMISNGASQIGSSRIEQLKECKSKGITVPLMLIRIPALSELPEVIQYSDISLQSELYTLKMLDFECKKQNKTHSVIIMCDLGDLREGFWDKNELVSVCETVENELSSLHLSGIGVNLGCYGSVFPTVSKMNELCALADAVEKRINRPLEIISGGATTSFPLVANGTMPAKINHLRIGEAILIGQELRTFYGQKDIDYLDMRVFSFSAEIIEIKEKPSYPQGELARDAFGNVGKYEDIGIRRRALLAFGRADVGDVTKLIPHDRKIRIVGASSDHCIIDITDSECSYKIGDIVSFTPTYSNVLYASSRSDVAFDVK